MDFSKLLDRVRREEKVRLALAEAYVRGRYFSEPLGSDIQEVLAEPPAWFDNLAIEAAR
jgi:hypothetical protein